MTTSANQILGFNINPNASAGLTVGFLSGSVLVGGVFQNFGPQQVTLPPSATVFVEVDARGVITQNVVGFTSGKNFLYIIATTATGLSSLKDFRLDPWAQSPAASPTYTALGVGKAATATSPLCASGIPTSSAGLVSGDFWLNTNVLTIVP